MKVSVNWIKQISERYAASADPMPDGIDELVNKIGARLGAVEEVVDVGKKYEGVVVVKVISCQKHPNADKLTVCLVDDGGAVKQVKRAKDGLIQIVCGAPNVKAGMLAAWIPPGNTVPSTYDKEAFILDAREIRGVVSNGMLASSKELAFTEEHEGILEIDESAKPGTPFAKVYKLDDYIIDIENKMFTHRPDCFGMLGVAREIAGIQHHVFKSPSWYKSTAAITGNGRSGMPLKVKNQVPKLVPRFCMAAMSDIKIQPSPVWLQTYLSRVGLNPINNIVDITNYLMLETAQPLHAYDYDKLKSLSPEAKEAEVGIRLSKKGEKLELLGGTDTVELDEGVIVITAGDNPIGLGGVRGGTSTAIDENTKSIVLECANFDMNLTRQTAMAYGQFTDAATRFTKNQSPLQNMAVLARAVEIIKEIAGGRVAGKPIDDIHLNGKTASDISVRPPVTLSRQFINSRLGLQLSGSEIMKLLKNVEFGVEEARGKLKVTAPFWRTDIGIAEDIVEEVGRLYGYDKLPQQLPLRSLAPAEHDRLIGFKSRIRGTLSSFGVNEVLTYSFVDGSLLRDAGLTTQDAYHIKNAIRPDLQYYRLNLAPSLLSKVHPNIKQGYQRFGLFELGAAHVKGIDDKHKLPAELQRLGVVLASNSKNKGSGAAFYRAKFLVSKLLNKLNVPEFSYAPLTEENNLSKGWRIVAQTFEPERTAAVYSGKNFLGLVGEPVFGLKAALKLPADCSQAELDVSMMLDVAGTGVVSYSPLNRYPSTDQDITLRTNADARYSELADFLKNRLAEAAKKHGYGVSLEPLDIFQKAGDKKHKHTTWRITLWHRERTLTTSETNELLDKIANRANKDIKAERI